MEQLPDEHFRKNLNCLAGLPLPNLISFFKRKIESTTEQDKHIIISYPGFLFRKVRQYVSYFFSCVCPAFIRIKAESATIFCKLSHKFLPMENFLPKEPFKNLALSLSGGGFRAAAFHLGLMTYLQCIDWNGTNLLERVRVLSTVSGGTFTGVCYATANAKKQTLSDCYKKLYGLFCEGDVIEKGLKKLEEYGKWDSQKGRSLINAVSLVYFSEFEENTFATLFDNESHLREIIFNATEFNYGLPFRFQKTAVSSAHFIAAYYGNKQVNMPPDAIREVRLADVIAASSCFPGGFEPINFPDDFRHGGSPVLNNLRESWKEDQWGQKCRFPVGLMDGGIVDNQGIDSVVNAEKRMKKYKGDLAPFASEDIKSIDLYIISDVSSPFMKSYIKTEEKKAGCWRNRSFRTLLAAGISLIAAGLLLGIAVFKSRQPALLFVSGFFASLFMISGATALILSNLFRWILKKFEVPDFFTNKLRFFTRMRFGVYETLVTNRISSVISMVTEVFMKQVRRQEYARVYNDAAWKPRLIMNAIYELSSVKKKETDENEKSFVSEKLGTPGKAITETANKAESMGTTLWFTPGQIEKGRGERNMPDALIACGQFTGCYNLLIYIEKTVWGKEYSEGYEKYPEELKRRVENLHKRLLSDWNRFNENPYWLIDEKFSL